MNIIPTLLASRIDFIFRESLINIISFDGSLFSSLIYLPRQMNIGVLLLKNYNTIIVKEFFTERVMIVGSCSHINVGSSKSISHDNIIQKMSPQNDSLFVGVSEKQNSYSKRPKETIQHSKLGHAMSVLYYLHASIKG